jgi:ferritin
MSDAAKSLSDYTPYEEDCSRCYLQLAAWADAGDRHRTSKYFYRRARQHWERVKALGKIAADKGGAVRFGALQAPYVGDPSEEKSADLLEWFTAAHQMEQKLLLRLEDVAEDLNEQRAHAAGGVIKDFIKQTVPMIAHLRRQVAHLAEAKGDPAALQAFDRNLG